MKLGLIDRYLVIAHLDLVGELDPRPGLTGLAPWPDVAVRGSTKRPSLMNL